MDSKVVASLHKHKRSTLERIEKYISDTYFTDVNLKGKVHPMKQPFDEILYWKMPGGEGSWQNWTFNQVAVQSFTPIDIGQSFGPTWTTHWFKVRFTIPLDWQDKEVVLVWKSQNEAMIWSSRGEPLQGLSSGTGHEMRTTFPLRSDAMVAGKQQKVYIEMACNKTFKMEKDGLINQKQKDEGQNFKLEVAELRLFDRDVYNLVMDLQIMYDLAKYLPDDPRGYEALYAANHIINAVSTDNWSIAKQTAADFFAKSKNGSRAHCLALMGHCHIPSAWMWPFSEGKRKCARSWASSLALQDRYPRWNFTCSQAQQFAFIQKYYPSLFEKIKDKVQEGRFIPVGGTWVEMDGLLPSGESFMRQFLYGQRFFMKEFGVKCKELWLPDTFAFSAQLPQICNHFGITRFMAQKPKKEMGSKDYYGMQWGLMEDNGIQWGTMEDNGIIQWRKKPEGDRLIRNEFPHNNFHWEGIDGSKILTHFPPGDSFGMNVSVKEARKTVFNLKDKGRVGTSAFIFGYGDVGGGPSAEMLEKARRMKDVDGCPRMEHMTPNTFFACVEAESKNLCKWVGELFLEQNSGTYTTQSEMKKLNRMAEFRLQSAEMLLAMAVLKKKTTWEHMHRYQEKIEEAWKDVLLNQTHHVLPGLSTELVNKEAKTMYEKAIETAKAVTKDCLQLLMRGSSEYGRFMFNCLPWKVEQVLRVKSVCLNGVEEADPKRRCLGRTQTTNDGEEYVYSVCDGIGFSCLQPRDCPVVTLSEVNGSYTLANNKISVTISPYGQVESLCLVGQPNSNVFGKQQKACSGNQIMLYDDIPLRRDAAEVTDYHMETGKTLNSKQHWDKIDCVTVVESGPLVVKLRWKMAISDKSYLTQDIELAANSPYVAFHTSVDWYENRKFLKMNCDTTIKSQKASFDIQFGHIERQTHSNTPWDSAHYEMYGHKWADIYQHGLGLAVLNDCKYGWTAKENSIILSLLRSPKVPDDRCDMGNHTFKYALMPHQGTLQEAEVVRRAYEFNNPLHVFDNITDCQGDEDLEVFMSLDTNNAMIDAVKLAEDGTGDVVVRLHEIHGGRCQANLSLPADIDAQRVSICDGLEEPQEDLAFTRMILDGEMKERVTIPVHLKPFQIQTLRVYQ
ncbi:alpha-mannosidase 2C1-like [Oratosquilla oratoria]|uniref:alpha-mannosidase 2C1-like n=1 Tax=Oratosquilla oratoria TaxID=337810 RepID=UPI003F772AD6